MKQKENVEPVKDQQKKTTMEPSTGKLKVLEATLSQIDKQYGNGAVMRLGQAGLKQIESISTGSILIDQALGVGGFPVGRIVEIFGPEASGKTTLALHVIAQSQKRGGICAFIDAEHALDPIYASNIGINVDDLIVSQPDYGEQALDIAEMLIRSGAIDIIVIDSVAALVPKAELEGDMGDTHIGLQARLMSQALRKLTPVVHKSKAILIIINQIRQNIRWQRTRLRRHLRLSSLILYSPKGSARSWIFLMPLSIIMSSSRAGLGSHMKMLTLHKVETKFCSVSRPMQRLPKE
jgi:recombination protein RecA